MNELNSYLTNLISSISVIDKSNNESEELKIIENYNPPNWIPLEFSYYEIVKLGSKIKEKKNLDEKSSAILNNYNLLKDCYCTLPRELNVAKYFIGKFDQDPFYNPYSFTALEKFAESNFIYLDGSSKEKDGFNIKNYVGNSLFINSPFSGLSDAAKICNQYALANHKPSIAFIANLDYTKYIKECFKIADYCIILGRTQFRPLPGLKNSSPRGSTVLLIYNSKTHFEGNRELYFENKEFYCINLKEKKPPICVNQMELFE